jgi:hypothetical protein
MPLVDQQAVIFAGGMNVAQAYVELERQMGEMPLVRIVSISSFGKAGDVALVAVVETV